MQPPEFLYGLGDRCHGNTNTSWTFVVDYTQKWYSKKNVARAQISVETMYETEKGEDRIRKVKKAELRIVMQTAP